jgi:hypothetical protein
MLHGRMPVVRRDTDDTKRADRDTRAIPESGNMVVSEAREVH